jgi:GNAT superfamily N-acetyltransferase
VPAHWRGGIGSLLHDRAVEAFRAGGCEVAHLWVLDENRVARSFYERRGWYLDGEERRAEFPPYPLDVRYSKRFQG